MNILLMSRIIARTGVGNHIHQLYNELVRQGHSVWVVASSNEMGIQTSNRGGYYYTNLNSRNPLEVVKNLIAIHRLIKQNHIEIVHCHHRMASLYMRIYNRIWRCPYVYTLHLAPIPSDLAHRMVTSCGDRAIAISKEVGDFLRDRFKVPESRISYVLNGVDESKLTPLSSEEKTRIRQEFGIDSNKTVVALHSRITAVKGLMEVAKAVNMLDIKQRKDIVILCSGEKRGKYYDDLVSYINDNHLEANFVFCGWRDARTVIGCADLMMLPSTVEGFGLSCIEAMFMKVPVARSKMGGFLDMSEYVNALDEVSPNCIATCIMELLSDKNKFQSKIDKAALWVHGVCTISAMTRNTVAVYHKVLQYYESK